MSGVNVHVSVSNLVQVDRHQSDNHRNPVVYQEQNAGITRDENTRRVKMPVEPDKAEGKKIDPENKKQESGRKSKKKREKKVKQQNQQRSRSDSGYMVDIQA